nr:hypothetical protein [Tanacetum cinerariifolium]
MALTFADTHNMIAYLTKSDASEGLEQILDFLNACVINLIRNVDSSSKFYMYPRYLQLMIAAQVGDLSLHTKKYTSHTLTQKVFANMRRVGKGFSGVDTPLFEGMLVPQQVNDVVADDVADVATNDVADELADVVAEDVSPTPSPLPHQSLIAQPSSPPKQPSPPSQPTTIFMDLLNTLLETCTTLTRKVEALEQDKIAQALEITKLKQRVRKLEKKRKLKVSGLKRLRKVRTAQQERLEEFQAHVYHIDLEHADKVFITAATTTITVAPSAVRRRKGVVIRDPETVTPSTIVHSELKSKDKGKGLLVEEPKPLKKQAQIEQDEEYARELEAKLNKNINWDDVIEKNMMVYLKNMAGFKIDFFKGMSYDDIRPIFEKHLNSIVGFLKKGKEHLEEEASKATPLALKVPVVDYQIHIESNKPHYKIIRADGTHELFLNFISLLRNFDRKDLEMLWQIVQLKLLDNGVDSRLSLLEQNAAVDDKMKK